MPPAGFEHIISAGERPQTHALDHAATGTGFISKNTVIMKTVHFVGVTNAVNPYIKMHAVDNFENSHLTLDLFNFDSCMFGITLL